MAGREAAFLVGVLLVGTAIAPLAIAQPAQIFPNISLGFDQASLTPVSQGTPLYTQGDQLWIESHYSYPVLATFSSPGRGIPGTFATLYPEQPVSLYAFGAGYPDGIWSLDISNSTGFISSMGIEVVSAGGSGLQYLGASLSPGFLSASWTVLADGAYDLQACELGSRTGGVQITIPQGIGTGLALLNLTRTTNASGATFGNYTVTVRGALLGPTEFWFELYHPYSFVAAGGNASELFSRLVQVGSSSRVVLGQNAGANVSTGTLSSQSGPRVGRYTLRGYFRTDQGIQVVESPLLLQRDGTWLPLSSCVATSAPSGLTFSLKTPLQAPVAAWPREVVVMFRLGGLEDYAASMTDPGLSALTMVASPWNQTLGSLTATVSGAGVVGSETVNGTVYVLSSSYPKVGSFDISMGGRTYETLVGTLPSSYSVGRLTVPAGKLVVRTTLAGAPSAGAKVALLAPGNFSISKTADSNGTATFYLPPGNFTVSSSAGGTVGSGSARVQAGTETDVTLGLGPTQTGSTILALEALAVVGLAANGYVWWRWWRNRRTVS